MLFGKVIGVFVTDINQYPDIFDWNLYWIISNCMLKISSEMKQCNK